MRRERYHASIAATSNPSSPAIARRLINGATSAFTSVFGVATTIAPIVVASFVPGLLTTIGLATARYTRLACGGVNSKVSDLPEIQSTVPFGSLLSPTNP